MCALWDFTQRRMTFPYRRSGTSSWTACPLKMRPIGFSETSVGNYNSKQCKSPKERRSHLQGGGSLKLHINTIRRNKNSCVRTDRRTGGQTDRNCGIRDSFFVAYHYETDTRSLQIKIHKNITCVFSIRSTKESWFDSRQGKRVFLPFKMSRVALGSNQSLTLWVPGPLPGIKRPGCEGDHSLPE